jgi:hypothetical protein
VASLDERFWFEEPTETEILDWEAERLLNDRPGLEETFSEFGGRWLPWIGLTLLMWFAVVGALYIGGVL